MVQFRRSKKVGPFRLTFGKRGMSLSGGVPGARVSVNSHGEVRRTYRLPGTGIYDTKKIADLDGTPAHPAGHAAPTGTPGTPEAPTIEGTDATELDALRRTRARQRGWIIALSVVVVVLLFALLAR